MNWTNTPAAENELGTVHQLNREIRLPPGSAAPQPLESSAQSKPPQIRIDKRLIPSAAGGDARSLEVFTLALGEEVIELLPFKNWSQLDHYKWAVRGKLPAAPAGLEIAPDHVKISGGTVAIADPAGCDKLERLFNEWLHFEQETAALARGKAQPHPLAATPNSLAQPGPQLPRFHVEMDKRGQVHITCVQGKETLATIGLNVTGFKSLYQQGLMRKPRTLETGALHDWVELDGELCSFDKGRNESARLEQILNERYAPLATAGTAKQVVVFLNPASSTGFDIQFPTTVAGVPDHHRRHLDDQSLALLQDADHCGLLHREIIVKLIPPNLVFKRKTADGGEQYLPWGPENTVNVTDEEGRPKALLLSQPLNLMRLGLVELAAVFNHPAINRHTNAAPPPSPASEAEPKPAAPGPVSQAPTQPVPPPSPPSQPQPLPISQQPGAGQTEPKPTTPVPESPPKPVLTEPSLKPVKLTNPTPNLWLKEVLTQPALPPDWFACLVYSKLAERFGNSSEGKFGPCDCWFITLGESSDIADPAFKGIILTQKRSFGLLSGGQMARFHNGVAFIGPQQSSLEGIDVNLVGVGLDARERMVFILSDSYRGQFGVPAATLAEALNQLRESGALIMSVKETLASPDPLEVVWTAPAEQADPNDPQARESTRAHT